MSNSLIDLDFETTTSNPSPQTLPLTGEALIGYSSPNAGRKKKSIEKTSGESNIFDELGMNDPTKKSESKPEPPVLDSSSDCLIDFSSPPLPKK
ncbi:hypothetical protein PPL_03925 [Heterostelium album PN500]|uniref:Uncharacterized protein n=1 Tax=Heterostelium pallidum (strain ATCC 26659 / Pp 5 / PN500) TaxID=670386 RepID=D3B5I7_HETP5|nr:hypothetical protein PPL_03925 [Heterostelium album PN500]EFA83135.1 hypothetical protein PPL_03925 [Heterostelium album PN500]|eukprot:XP_020435252.1 hypothetical protein PPL_03925 [Heterostelium album PN500]